MLASSQRGEEKIELVQVVEHIVTEEYLSIFNINGQ